MPFTTILSSATAGLASRTSVTPLSLLVLMIMQMSCTAQSAPPSEGIVREDDEFRQITPADWSLLMDKDRTPPNVTKLKLIMYEKKPRGKGGLLVVEPREPCEIETTDPVLLAGMSFFLDLPYRAACPETPDFDHVLTDASQCLGELQVTTPSRQFMLGITHGGFALESKESSYRNSFKSWGVATVVDRMLREHGQQGLSAALMVKLSPEGRIEVEKRHLKRQEELLRSTDKRQKQ